MDNCGNHKKDLYGETDMNKIAEAIGDLHYETLYELFERLVDKFEQDAIKDHMAGRRELSDAVWSISLAVYHARYAARKAWKISEPYMSEQIKQL